MKVIKKFLIGYHYSPNSVIFEHSWGQYAFAINTRFQLLAIFLTSGSGLNSETKYLLLGPGHSPMLKCPLLGPYLNAKSRHGPWMFALGPMSWLLVKMLTLGPSTDFSAQFYTRGSLWGSKTVIVDPLHLLESLIGSHSRQDMTVHLLPYSLPWSEELKLSPLKKTSFCFIT